MNFKALTRVNIQGLLDNSKYERVITWYFVDADGWEHLQSSSDGSEPPFFHKDDIYIDSSTVSLPKGSFSKLGINLAPMQVLGLVDTTGEYVVSYLCTDKMN